MNVIPIDRIIRKLDEHLNKNDYDGALRHLLYWKEEAGLLGDKRGLLTLNSELMGLYRKISKKTEAMNAAGTALRLLRETEQEDTATAGTVLTNAATVFNAFGEQERSLELFTKAKEVYEKLLSETDARLGALYNNLGLTLVALKRYREAEEYYLKALGITSSSEKTKLDEAITHLNLCNLYEAEEGVEKAFEKITERLEAAQTIIESYDPEDGYYAFVCEKCANTFGYYGLAEYARMLKARAKDIYERA